MSAEQFLRQCKNCGGYWPLETWPQSKPEHHADGFDDWCRECINKRSRIYSKAKHAFGKKKFGWWYLLHDDRDWMVGETGNLEVRLRQHRYSNRHWRIVFAGYGGKPVEKWVKWKMRKKTVHNKETFSVIHKQVWRILERNNELSPSRLEELNP